MPLVGFVGRLTDQKGIDLVVDVMQRWVQTSDVQWAILGTGEPKYHQAARDAGRALPAESGRPAWSSRTPWPIASRPAADIFLMPSRFEPCGLNQLYSLKYGTVPLVRATGGLADTITGYDAQTPNPAANGFVFQEYSPLALSECLRQACDAYRRPERLAAAGAPPA